MKRLLAVNDLSCVGKCSLSVMLPVVSASGVACACLPTALLSTHSGGFHGLHCRELGEEALPIAEHWRREGISFDGICTGYMASAAQGRTVAQLLAMLAGKDTKVVIDPAMADNGGYYRGLGDEVCLAFRKLLVRADLITPNVTEAALLTGLPVETPPFRTDYIRRLLEKLAEQGPERVVITSVRSGDGRLGNAALDAAAGEEIWQMRDPLPGSYHGAGDMFTAALAALLLRGAALGEAMDLAACLVRESIRCSILRGEEERWGLAFEDALPAYVLQTEAYFEEKGRS